MSSKRTARKPGGHPQGWAPNHHGTRAVLITPYVMGLVWAIGAGRFSWSLALLAPVWVIDYLAFFATATWLKSNSKPRYRRAVLTHDTVTVILNILLLALKPAWWAWTLVFGPLTGIGLWLAWKRHERSLLSGFVMVLVAAGLPLVLDSEGSPNPGGLPVPAGLSLACFGYFFDTMFYIGTDVWGHGRASYIVYSIAWRAACAVLFVVVDFHLPRWWLVAFFVACTLRTWLVPSLGVMKGRKVTTKQLDYTEMIAIATLLAILISGMLITWPVANRRR